MARRLARIDANLLAPHLRDRPMSYVEAAALFGISHEHLARLVTAHKFPKFKRRVGKHPRLHVALPPETIQSLKDLLWGKTQAPR